MTHIRVLTPDEIDVLELALNGLLPELPAELRSHDNENVTFADMENTPVASVSELGGLSPLKPLALAPGPLAVESVRLSSPRPTSPGSVAVWLTDLLTRTEEAELDEIFASADRVVLAVPSSRHTAPSGAVHATRILAYAQILTSHSETATVTVVPWPSAPESFSGLEPTDLSIPLGVDRVLTPIEDRANRLPHAAHQVDSAVRDAVERLYSPAAAKQLLATRAHATPRGQVLFFTGLSGSGKSTIANALAEQLVAEGLTVSLLDGDEVRQHLSKGLTFSPEDRVTNIERIGFATSLVAKHGGLAIAAPIAPFSSTRATVRELVESAGGQFHLIWICTPLEVCEARDRKGLYAKARAGEIPDFTGISSPYEDPEDADLAIDASQVTVATAVKRIRELIT